MRTHSFSWRMQGTWIPIWETVQKLFMGNAHFEYLSDFERQSKAKGFFLFWGICKLNGLTSSEGREQLFIHSRHPPTFRPKPTMLSCNAICQHIHCLHPLWSKGPCDSFRSKNGEQKWWVLFWARASNYQCKTLPISLFPTRLVSFKTVAALSTLTSWVTMVSRDFLPIRNGYLARARNRPLC